MNDKTISDRVNELRDYSILDTLPEASLDNIVELASIITKCPISLISLLDEDRQWFKAKKGIEACETGIDVSFCNHAIQTPEKVFIVTNAKDDPRFKDNALVTSFPFIVSYAGASLVTPKGIAIGKVCAIDDKSRDFDKIEIESLELLSKLAMALFESRKKALAVSSFLGLARETLTGIYK